MPKIEQLGFMRSLAAAFSVVLIALVAVTVFTWSQLDTIAAETAEANDRLVPQLEHTTALELAVTRVSLQVRHAMLVRTPEDLAKTLDDVAAKRKLIDAEFAEYTAHVKSDRGRQLAAEIRTRLDAFWAAGEANLALIQAGRKDEAFAHLVATLIPTRNQLLETLDASHDLQKELLAGLVQAAEANANRTQVLLAAALGGVALLLCLTGWVMAGYLKRRIQVASDIAAHIGAGDLSQTIVVSGQDEFRPMLQQLSDMQQKLSSLVGQVRGTSESIQTASAEIATGNHDLSQRTEQTASNLQQTASSMEQLTGTVRQSADSARQANQLAASAAEVAARGGSVVSEVVSTMDEINAASKKIADIIGVIDGIAFQTNILALNAAVEAARAGEQGRGFAVVASEVRNLASRSAEAAREIKALIGASVDKVESGSRLVANAGSTMTELVSSVQRVSDIIGEITAAAAEQSEGIGQVNGAVTQLDQMTQQNAALVEQSAAAAESLKEQSRRLSEVMSGFRLEAAR